MFLYKIHGGSIRAPQLAALARISALVDCIPKIVHYTGILGLTIIFCLLFSIGLPPKFEVQWIKVRLLYNLTQRTR